MHLAELIVYLFQFEKKLIMINNIVLRKFFKVLKFLTFSDAFLLNEVNILCNVMQ